MNSFLYYINKNLRCFFYSICLEGVMVMVTYMKELQYFWLSADLLIEIITLLFKSFLFILLKSKRVLKGFLISRKINQ